MDKIRVGVIGAGALGQHHARIYAAFPDVTLAGVVDILPQRAREIAAACDVPSFTDYHSLFGKVDAVSIAAPTSLHGEIGTRFLDEGVNVLVEKPITSSLKEADRLIRAAASNDRILQVGHLERFNPAVRAVRGIVRHPRFFEAHRMGLFSPRSLDIDVILDLMIHDLDIISLLVPAPAQEIQAVGIAILTSRIDIANARIRFADGCVANVTASRVSMEKIRKLRLFHEREYISLDYTRQDVSIFSLESSGGQAQINGRKLTPPRCEPLEAELRSFLDASRGRTPVECTGEEGRKSLDLALRVAEKALQAQAVEIDRH